MFIGAGFETIIICTGAFLFTIFGFQGESICLFFLFLVELYSWVVGRGS